MFLLDVLDAIFSLIGLAGRAGGAALAHSRRQSMRNVADTTGRRYLARDHHLIQGSPFAFFKTRRGVAVNVISGDFAGHQATVFDFNCASPGAARPGTANSAPQVFTCIEIPIAAHCPHIEIAPAPPGPDPALRPPLTFESERFNRAWRVRCEDRAFASALVDARMMDYLLSIDRIFTFELSRFRLLVRSPLLAPGRLTELATVAFEFRERVPRVLASLATQPASK